MSLFPAANLLPADQPPKSFGEVPIPNLSSWIAGDGYREPRLHQLSPYIGKLKSRIARDLIETYTKKGDLVLDPFAGSGTIPLEARIGERKVLACDVNPYAKTLCLAKLNPPATLDLALERAEDAMRKSQGLPKPDLRAVPSWVRTFFHPETLRELITLSKVLRASGSEFLFACLLGILHHQRPGFLSYPSSHLVPYLRSKNFPREKYPHMYKYRDVRSRLLKKVERVYSNLPTLPVTQNSFFFSGRIQDLQLNHEVDSIITSPPYMNALDYGRDNRLRLWFISPDSADMLDHNFTKRFSPFKQAIASLAWLAQNRLRCGGYCVLIVGEKSGAKRSAHPSDTVIAEFELEAPSLKLCADLVDNIPDIRRARRSYQQIKREHFLVYQK